MISTTAGRLWLSHGLPAKYRDNAARLDSKGVSALLDRVAREDPEDYPKVVKHLIDVGKTVAYRTGGYSFGLKSLRKPAAAIQVGDQIRTALATLYADPRTSPQEKRDGAIDAIAKAGEGYEKKVYDEALADNNPIALQVLSGSRGKPSTLQTLIGGDLMYQDSQGRPIPVPVTRSYSQGLTPAQYFAGAYGARTGVIGTKLLTANAGFLGKQFVGSSHRLITGELDHDEAKNGVDPNTHRGLPVDTSDKGNVGSLLAKEMGGYKRNTVLTGKILRDLSDQGLGRILVRSPITSSSTDGTIYGRDAGVRERGGIPSAGDQIGIAAAQAIGEIVSQSSLGSKHCLAAGTLVRMADGSAKPIELVAVGDEVCGGTHYGTVAPTRVVRVYDNGPRPCRRYTFRAANRGCPDVLTDLVCTPEHKVLRDCNDERLAQNTKAGSAYNTHPLAVWEVGDWAAPLDVESAARWDMNTDHQLVRIEDAGDLPTYDIEVDHPDHLFVLADNLIVSNSGGISKGVSQGPTGFKLLNLLAQAPKGSPFWAAHAGEDGAVKSIESSPAGGWTVRVGSGEHHVPPTAELKVKLGDRVEAGDLLSSGIPDPNELVKHLHVGEARNRFMKEFRKAVGAGSTERRNLELVSRGLINHVKMTDEHQDWLPDDVVPYDVVERSWKPREDAVVRRPHEAVGQYLELPVLHYSVGCFDDKTEALTARGWVPWPEVEQTDLLATVREGRLTFERPLVLVRAPYSGELLTFEGRYIDYAVTPNHRFYVGRYHSPEKGFHFEEAQKLHGARFRIPQFGFPQTSEAVPTIRIGEYDVDYGDYAELVGWWASEGTARVKTAKNGFVKLYQSSLANPEKFEAIEQLVRRLPFPKWHYVKNKGVKWGVGISYGPLAAHLLQYGTHSHNKRLPRHLLDQPPEILSRTYDAMMAGDGAHSVTLGCRSGVYHTVSRGLADDMQELCIRAGHGAIPHYDAPKGHRGHIWRCGIALNRTVAQVGGFGQRFGKIDYDGVVYCAEMETGLLYVRRNGKPMLSGNSHIKPSVSKELQHFGVDSVVAHHQPPPFQPHFVRAMENLQNDQDVFVQHMGSNLQKSTLKAVHRGGTSDENSTSFVPSLMRGKDFGKTGPVKSYALGDVSKVL